MKNGGCSRAIASVSCAVFRTLCTLSRPVQQLFAVVYVTVVVKDLIVANEKTFTVRETQVYRSDSDITNADGTPSSLPYAS